MVKNRNLLRRFEKECIRREKISYGEAFKIFEAMYRQARSLGALSSSDILAGIDTDIRMARIIHRMKSV